jgi:hypothetical protein
MNVDDNSSLYYIHAGLLTTLKEQLQLSNFIVNMPSTTVASDQGYMNPQ